MKPLLLALTLLGVACDVESRRTSPDAGAVDDAHEDASTCACTMPPTPASSRCEPALDGCFQSRVLIDCDSGGSSIACRDGDCRWFVGESVPDGYVVSACPADNITCENGSPFPAGTPGAEGAGVFIRNRSTKPWGREFNQNLTVTVDEELSIARDEFHCTPRDRVGGLGWGCAEQAVATPSVMYDTLSVTVVAVEHRTPTGTELGMVELEVDPVVGRARACLTTPLGNGDGFECARRGTVTLSRMPERCEENADDIHVHAEFEFFDGLSLVLDLAGGKLQDG